MRNRASLNNHALLSWARESAGFTIPEVAQKLGVAEIAVANWEHGRAAPTLTQLDDFARIVKRSVAILYLPTVPSEPPPPEDYRRLPTSLLGDFSHAALFAFRSLRHAASDLSDLSALLDEPMEMRIPIARISGDAEAAAEEFRAALGVSMASQMEWTSKYEALDAWRSALFNLGVLVQQFPLALSEIRGFSLTQGPIGAVGISSHDDPTGRIFSVFHEIGHLALRRPGVSRGGPDDVDTPDPSGRVERYCNLFAGAFLLPKGERVVLEALSRFAQDLDRSTAERYARQLWTSKYALAWRTAELGLIAPETCRRVTDAWQEHDRHLPDRRGNPTHLSRAVSRQGKRFVGLVLEAMDRSLLHEHQAARMLQLRVADLQAVRERVHS